MNESKETTDKYKTSKRIRFATDNWGGRDETHLEIAWGGTALMVDITDECIHIVGPGLEVKQHAVNALNITPAGRGPGFISTRKDPLQS